jgi:flagellar hook-associated protein 3 FlgL
MPERVNQETFYRQTLYDILRMRYDQFQLSNQASSGKRINNPSDDPVGSITTQASHRSMEEVTQYGSNVRNARDWLSLADSTMQSMSTLLVSSKAKAEQASTGTYSGAQRGILSTDVESSILSLVSLANTRLSGKCIFAGTRNNQLATTGDLRAETPATSGSANTGDGKVYGQGTPTFLLSRNITITVTQAPAGGTPTVADPMDVSYSYVDDYNRTVTGSARLTGTGSAGAVDVGGGVQVFVDGETFATNDTYTLKIGRHLGNTEALEATLSQNSRVAYNFSLDDLFRSEGNSGGQWNNILDILADWKDALTKDNKVQDYFETLPGVKNNPGSSAQLQVSGAYDALKLRQLEMQVGGPIQFMANAASADDTTVDGRSYQFYLEPGGNTGQPSASNPITLRYYYWNAGAWTAGGTLNVTGTGQGNPVTLADNGGDVSIFLANSVFDANNLTTFAAAPTGGPPPTANGGLGLTTYADKTQPSAATPVDCTYTLRDDLGARRYGSLTFSETGSRGAWTVPLEGATLSVASNVSTTTLSGRQYEFYLDNAAYSGTPSAANPMDLHYRYQSGGAWVDGGVITVTGTGPENSVQLSALNAGEDVRIFVADGSYDSSSIGVWGAGGATSALSMDLTGDRATLTLSENGVVDDGDTYAATLEQYNQGQAKSQEALDAIQAVQRDLLKQNGAAGARLNNLDVRDQLLEKDTLRLNSRLSQVEDADITTVTTNLSQYQNLYQATLQAAAMVTSKTLADYL